MANAVTQEIYKIDDETTLSYLDGHINYIVDLTFDECVENLIAPIKLLNSLGFITIKINLYSYQNWK